MNIKHFNYNSREKDKDVNHVAKKPSDWTEYSKIDKESHNNFFA